MSVKAPAPPPLPPELEALLRRLRLPYIRKRRTGGDRDRGRAALGARRDPARPALEEAAGRDQATIATRRRSSQLPAGKTLDAWEQNSQPDTESRPSRR